MPWLLVGHRILGPESIVIISILPWQSHLHEWLILHGFPDVPHFQQLVFAIRRQIDAILFAGHMRDAFCMPHKDTCRSVTIQCATVPYFDQAIVTTAEENV